MSKKLVFLKRKYLSFQMNKIVRDIREFVIFIYSEFIYLELLVVNR